MTSTGLVLRPYQREALAAIDAAETRGVRAQMGVAATGLGKTVMFVALAKHRPGRSLILAHRDELISQARAKVLEVWPDAQVGVVKADRNETDAHVVVASVQTLARGKRLEDLIGADRMIRPDPFDLVVVDEAHHAAAPTYREILGRLNAGRPDGPLLLGVTATPDRGDGEGLDEVFDEIVWSYDLLWGIRAGFLADVRGLRVTIPKLDLSSVKMSRGDYQAGASGAALLDADGPAEIVEAWTRYASDRSTLVFTPTVVSAEAVAAAFTSAGVAASCVYGELEMNERRRRLAAYANGDVRVMVNCMVLTEGYDNPRTDCVVVARPTKSRALYTQMVGRGTRRHLDKTDLLVLDVVGATDQHSLVTVPSLFGVPDGWEGAGDLTDGAGAATSVLDAYDQHLVLLGQMRAEQADLFKKIRGEGIAWVPVGEPPVTVYVCGMGDAGRVYLWADESGWVSYVTRPDGTQQVLFRGTQQTAQGAAENFIRSNAASGLVNADAKWRSAGPSSKQIALARRLGIEFEGMTKGELSDAITARFESRKQQKAPTS